MTNDRAIEILSAYKQKLTESVSTELGNDIMDFDMAIEILSEGTDGDLISRKAVLNSLYALCDTGETLKENPWRDNPHIDAITDAIDALPSAEKTAKWIDLGVEDEWFGAVGKCSKCGNDNLVGFNYCINCGARMVESEVKNEDNN